MAIHLISGVPGAGKTLRAVDTVRRLIDMEAGQDRPLFGNVNGLKAQSPIPDEWMDCPDGAIVLIDECQQRWRRYRSTGTPPAEISALETHRHRGIDFVLTCQNPQQLTADVRSLVDTHEHLMRKGGLNGAVVSRWEGQCHSSPASHRKDADCEQQIWRYPKEVFSMYQSASMHTVQRRLPRILYVAPAVLIAAVVAIYFAFSSTINTLILDANADDSSSDTSASRQSELNIGQAAQSSEREVVVATSGGSINDEICRLFDSDGVRLNVSLPVCLDALEFGLPQSVEVMPR
ncbi:zonular occludens toxin domain-containing protein [Kushneria aurantia]|uniref:Zonular occludens toxin domain-containing protein n=1 Tax=Kushneria aurantia TaxID=504092 RepID=A0ABV6G2Y4_9GAMM|nr:zonular occludens toxin domain-containing protein [Kushneria aurantia]